jgi:hypothetical protein
LIREPAPPAAFEFVVDLTYISMLILHHVMYWNQILLSMHAHGSYLHGTSYCMTEIDQPPRNEAVLM